jgi:hypothetical protein
MTAIQFVLQMGGLVGGEWAELMISGAITKTSLRAHHALNR